MPQIPRPTLAERVCVCVGSHCYPLLTTAVVVVIIAVSGALQIFDCACLATKSILRMHTRSAQLKLARTEAAVEKLNALCK